MKKIIIIFFILKYSLTFSQNFNDKIITITGETILCRITLINDNNIFYELKIKKNIQQEYISIQKVKTYIISKDNKPEILCKQKDTIKSPTKFDSLQRKKILVAESSKFRGWQTNPTRAFFDVGKKIKIKRFNNDTIIKGNIEYITDSSITLNGKQVKLNEIKSINKVNNRGNIMTTIGLSTLVISIGMIASSDLVYPEKYGETDEDLNHWSRFSYELGFAFSAFIGGVITIIGIIDMATIKHYRMDKKWKLYVNTVN